MRTAGLVAALASLGLPAVAGSPAFDAAVKTGHWQGCVYEEGYAPYPIVLTARGSDFFVTYPELSCIGGHNAGTPPEGFDAMEIIVVDEAGRCATNLALRYSLEPGGLRIDYYQGAPGTFAMLHPALPGANPPACNEAEAIS